MYQGEALSEVVLQQHDLSIVKHKCPYFYGARIGMGFDWGGMTFTESLSELEFAQIQLC